jgi:hypothetical protein
MKFYKLIPYYLGTAADHFLLYIESQLHFLPFVLKNIPEESHLSIVFELRPKYQVRWFLIQRSFAMVQLLIRVSRVVFLEELGRCGQRLLV